MSFVGDIFLAFKRMRRFLPFATSWPEYAADPVGFARDILGVTLCEHQARIARAFVDSDVDVSASFASGKTYLAAVLILWWAGTRHNALAIVEGDALERKILALQVRILRARSGRKIESWPWEVPFKFDQPTIVVEDGLSLGLRAISRGAAREQVVVSVSAFDTPNVQSGSVVAPGLVTLEWVEHARQRFGESSEFYRTRVLGEPPTETA